MKKVSLIINIVIGLALIALYILFFTDNSRKREATAGEAAGERTEIASGQIVYIQIDSLLNDFNFCQELQADFEEKAKIVSDDLQKKGRQFDKDVSDFQNKVQKGLITRTQAEKQQAQLAKRQQELEQYGQQKQMELQEENQVMLNRVIDAIKTFLITYNQAHEYAMIITTDSRTNTIIEADSSLDITKDVVEGLNLEYASK